MINIWNYIKIFKILKKINFFFKKKIIIKTKNENENEK